MSNDIDTDEDEPGFFRRYRFGIIVVAIVLVGAIGYFAFGKKSAPKRKAPEMSMVALLPPPPPPPPPKQPPTPPPEQQPPKEEEKFVAEEKPDEAPPEPKAEEPSPDLGTSIKGDGAADGFGLSGSGSGGKIGGSMGGGGTKYGAYAGMVQQRVSDALRNHKRTKNARLSLKVRVWADASGRITRATIEGSSGDAATDNAIRNEILNGLLLREPPPKDMPMPIVMRITAKRP